MERFKEQGVTVEIPRQDLENDGIDQLQLACFNENI